MLEQQIYLLASSCHKLKMQICSPRFSGGYSTVKLLWVWTVWISVWGCTQAHFIRYSMRVLFIFHFRNRKSMCNFSGIISRVQPLMPDNHAFFQSMRCQGLLVGWAPGEHQVFVGLGGTHERSVLYRETWNDLGRNVMARFSFVLSRKCGLRKIKTKATDW